jgi:hypothetical protein
MKPSSVPPALVKIFTEENKDKLGEYEGNKYYTGFVFTDKKKNTF